MKNGISRRITRAKDKLRQNSDFKNAFYISLAIFSVMAFIAGIIIVEVVRF